MSARWTRRDPRGHPRDYELIPSSSEAAWANLQQGLSPEELMAIVSRVVVRGASAAEHRDARHTLDVAQKVDGFGGQLDRVDERVPRTPHSAADRLERHGRRLLAAAQLALSLSANLRIRQAAGFGASDETGAAPASDADIERFDLATILADLEWVDGSDVAQAAIAFGFDDPLPQDENAAVDEWEKRRQRHDKRLHRARARKGATRSEADVPR